MILYYNNLLTPLILCKIKVIDSVNKDIFVKYVRVEDSQWSNKLKELKVKYQETPVLVVGKKKIIDLEEIYEYIRKKEKQE